MIYTTAISTFPRPQDLVEVRDTIAIRDKFTITIPSVPGLDLMLLDLKIEHQVLLLQRLLASQGSQTSCAPALRQRTQSQKVLGIN